MRAPCPLVRRGAKVPGGIRKTPPTTPGFRVYSYFILGGFLFRAAARKMSGHGIPGRSHVAATVDHAWFGSCAFPWRHREARPSKWSLLGSQTNFCPWASRLERSFPRLWTVGRRSAVVEEGTIVTAVAGSPKERGGRKRSVARSVGGPRTQKSSRERPARSIHQHP
jgi:hypothetical protein